ncbi:cytochrome P450 [Streptomyces ipomoeae]|jgi:pentalenene oxygenase|uniref:Cytochrome P450 n=1 Tax=Streptomyces ipomoeae TaxID=103232 RepID=A0AAE8W7M1_9ACTN|nr:cytochrome P450 [Streptomyces ipomoeae]MDX2827383.1 cytochrome P450 [Streptomyces ipomoeae]MDX2880544.1 cytochrome P450 [Streptomyces ipomoeae]TQE25193.1 cytochrome P450 [Streptomyces ipomoeae]TQE36547.1 cytochrome P450 [Streptomyces ipomoeae]
MYTSNDPHTFGIGPKAYPILGHASHLLRNPIPYLSELAHHGDLVEVRLGNLPVYVPCHPTLIRTVLAEDGIWDKSGWFWEKLRGLAGSGVAGAPHAVHRRQRRLMQPSFSRGRVSEYAAIMTEEAVALQSRWSEGQLIEPFQELQRYALRTVIRSLLAPVAKEEHVETVRNWMELADGTGVVRALLPPALKNIPTSGNREFRDENAAVWAVADDLVEEARRARKRGEERTDMLAVYVAAQDDQGMEAVGGAHARDQVMSLLIAGSETVSTSISWTFCLLAQNPELERKLHEEVDTVLGGRPARMEDLARLPFTLRTVTETLRMFPATYLLPRRLSADVEMAGRTLPAGSVFVFSPYVVQRNARYFDEPHRFDPDRWLPERATPQHRQAYIPFAYGARKCIGDHFALTEAVLLLATFAANWRLRLPDGETPSAAWPAITAHPSQQKLQLSRRGQAATR